MRTVFSVMGFIASCGSGEAEEKGPAGCVWATGGAGLSADIALEPAPSCTVYSVASYLRGPPSLLAAPVVFLNVSLIVSSRGATTSFFISAVLV